MSKSKHRDPFMNTNPYYEDRNLLPEQKLWKSVLGQAIQDFVQGDYRCIQSISERYDSEKWVSLQNMDFRFVCELAGFSSEYIYRKTLIAKEEQSGKRP